MRIQHNITAMNSYRNYSANTKSVAKNLEKLSSGYRINRAGDDAAGLAISEKMRAQITGLETAQKNAKDGISLVQTAEGALTEVHSMLNRMVELADQSANGTYDNETDRANLQKEVTQLKSEINRIADSTNFNGIKLLDGSLNASGTSTSTNGVLLEVTKPNSAAVTYTAALGTTATLTAANDTGAGTGTFAAGDTVKFEFAVDNGDGTSSLKSLEFTVGTGGTSLTTKDGASYAFTANGTAFQKQLGDAISGELNKLTDVTDKFTVSVDGTGVVTLASKEKGANAPKISMVNTTLNLATPTDVDAAGPVLAQTQAGADAYESIDLAQVKAYDSADTTADKKDSIITVNGVKVAFAKDAASAKALVDEYGKDINVITDADGNTTLAAADAAEAVKVLNAKAGLAATATGAVIDLKPGTTTTAASAGKGLTLQIGDTSDKFNKLTVSIGDMHAASLGINGVDISTQEGGSAAVQMIKDAINSVSSTRGDLGATQNRLDHTINNLAVMTENIQDAESSIRDVDVAKEMMSYTKNNILVQSAQAMLAQANQLPQGVLQLLG